MTNENTALVKSLAIGVFAAGALALGGPAALWRAARGGAPLHALVAGAVLSAAVSPSPSFAWPAALLAGSLWCVAAAAAVPAPAAGWRRAVTAAALLPVAHALLQAAGLDPTGWAPLVRDHF